MISTFTNCHLIKEHFKYYRNPFPEKYEIKTDQRMMWWAYPKTAPSITIEGHDSYFLGYPLITSSMTLRPFIKRLKYILQIWDTSQYINSWRKCRNYYISRFVTPIDHRTSHVFAVYVYSCWFTLIYILSMQKFEYHQATLRNITDTQSFRFGSHFVIFHLKQFGKIILHRIISVVWITIFLSENRSYCSPVDEVKH